MVVLNGMSRYHLAILAVQFGRLTPTRVAELTGILNQLILDATHHAREHFEDAPEIRDWQWTDGLANP
jgi:xylulose-5-phosphate/fructose-6-phosphate phosphoketolase